MTQLATTKMSSKGQIVIPELIREQMHLSSGDQFVVMADKDFVILKAIKRPSKDEFRALVTKARKQVKSAGLTNDGLEKLIKTVRKK
tara:strand:- start:1134 stop:1394 length:261 start_codon:yes stop_codon:yes gene_type:complete